MRREIGLNKPFQVATEDRSNFITSAADNFSLKRTRTLFYLLQVKTSIPRGIVSPLKENRSRPEAQVRPEGKEREQFSAGGVAVQWRHLRYDRVTLLLFSVFYGLQSL
ncbi:hypothetical protein SUGI_0421100 [Cryptomeria japonica]|nr:hypothetical protein SUGI_0421100 [Cryptomeria japonica]